ncbi:MAG: hypothetical protein M3O20_08250 [Acidobacteriota bacterium]|nr:hypothetical protein [Acidobacteriota bacterium]
MLDRIAVIVGKHVIKTSDIDLDQRLTALLNGEALSTDSRDKRRSAERLIDQEIIRQEIISGGFRRPSESQAAALEAQLTRDRFGGSAVRLREALEHYGLSENNLREELLWQLTVLSFIDQRFQSTAAISDEDVRSYYEQHLTELRRNNPQSSSFQTLEPQIRKAVESERVTESFNQWLGQARNRYRIEYKQEALK